MEITENYEILDRAEVALALSGLVIERITRSYELITPTHYVMRTQLLFQNLSNHNCIVVPGEFYRKEVLIDFKAHDGNNIEGISISSDKNDMLLVKYVFLKMSEDVNNSTFPQEIKSEAKKALCYQFTNQEKFLKSEDVSKGDIEQALDGKLAGPLANDFFESMWKGKPINSLLSAKLAKGIPAKYEKMCQDIRNLRIMYICSLETRNFIRRFENCFLQLILLRTPIPPGDYGTLILETEKFRRSQKKSFRLSEELKFPLDICPVLPNQENPTFHYWINPPEGVQFRKCLCFRQILRPPEQFFFLREEALNPEYFDILHISPSERCTRTLDSLKISRRSATRTEVLNEIFKETFVSKRKELSKEKGSSQDIRAQIENNLIFLYFRNPRRGEAPPNESHEIPCIENDEPLCDENHEVKINLELERTGVCFFHYLLIFFLFCTIALCGFWLSEMFTNPNIEIPNSFWTFAFFVVVQSVSVIFDYSRRNNAQRYFMRINVRFILSLIFVVILLMLAMVVLPLLTVRFL